MMIALREVISVLLGKLILLSILEILLKIYDCLTIKLGPFPKGLMYKWRK